MCIYETQIILRFIREPSVKSVDHHGSHFLQMLLCKEQPGSFLANPSLGQFCASVSLLCAELCWRSVLKSAGRQYPGEVYC